MYRASIIVFNRDEPPPWGRGKHEEGDRQRKIHPHNTCFRLFHFLLAGSGPLRTRTGTHSPALPGGCFPSHWSIPSARNSQLQEDTLPGRQAPCAQDASSMSSPLSLGGEHRADGHAPAAALQSHTHTAPPLTGVRWELDQNKIPAVVQQGLQMFLTSSWRGCMDRSPHGTERQSSCQNNVTLQGRDTIMGRIKPLGVFTTRAMLVGPSCNQYFAATLLMEICDLCMLPPPTSTQGCFHFSPLRRELPTHRNQIPKRHRKTKL